MPSQINYLQIDSTYPVAGVDNSSQGFRDNFGAIKTALATANSEITSLQSTRASTVADNDFNGNTIHDANASGFTQTAAVLNDELDNQVLVDFEAGHYQSFITVNNMELTFANWPDSERYAAIRIELITPGGGSTHTISFANSGPSGSIFLNPSIDLQLANNENVYVFDAWTADGGSRVFINFIGQFTN